VLEVEVKGQGWLLVGEERGEMVGGGGESSRGSGSGSGRVMIMIMKIKRGVLMKIKIGGN